MATIRFLIDVAAPNAAKVFTDIAARLDKLDEQMRKTRDLSIGDKAAMATVLKTQLAVDRLRDRVTKPMDLTIRGAAGAEAKLLTLEATADRLNSKLDLKATVDVDRSWLSRLFGGGLTSQLGTSRGGGALAGLLGAVTGGAANTLPAATSLATPTAGPVVTALSNPYVAAGAAAAVISALPLAATAAAGAIVGTLGTALTGLGVAGAIGTKQVSGEFAKLQADATADLTKIGAAFVPVLTSILSTADSVLPYVTRPLAAAMQAIAGPLQLVGEELAMSFASPAVAQAIRDVGSAFAKFLQALAPQIPGIVKALANGIDAMAQAFLAHPGMIAAMADVLAFLLKIPGYIGDALAALTRFAHWDVSFNVAALSYVIGAFEQFGEALVHDWGNVTGALSSAWDVLTGAIPAAWHDSLQFVENVALDAAKLVLIAFRDLASGVLGVIGSIIDGLAKAFGWIPFGLGSSLKHAASSFDGWKSHFISGINDQINHLTSLQNSINGLHGKDVPVTVHVTGSGGEKIISTVGPGGQVNVYPVKAAAAGWRVPGYGNRDSVPAMLTPGEAVVPVHLVPAIAPFLAANRVPGFAAGGIAGSADQLGNFALPYFEAANAAVLAKALSAVDTRALSALAGGGVSGNVGQEIRAALALAAAPPSWAGLLAVLVARESGGNARAVNPIAVLGQHATGMWQMLPSTFAQYAAPGWSIWNPVQEGAAAIRYIRAVYGSPSSISGLTRGTYYGYASGGIIPEPVAGIGLRSGARYSFGENGPETVVPGTAARGVNINISEMNIRHESDVAVVAQRLSGMIRMASLGGGFSG